MKKTKKKKKKSSDWNSFVVKNDGGTELLRVDKNSGLTTIDTLKLKKPIQLVSSDSLLTQIATLKSDNTKLKSDVAALKSDNTKLKSDIAALQARKLAVRSKSNASDGDINKPVVVNCDAGGVALTCANSASVSGDAQKTASRGATSCTCSITNGGFLSRVRKVKKKRIFDFCF